MIYNLVSVRSVIAKVLSDLDIREEMQRTSDYIEWASEAIEKIGSVAQLERRVSGVDGEPYLEIKNYQSSLPPTLFRLNVVAFSETESGEFKKIDPSMSSINVWGPGSDQSMNAQATGKVVYTIKPGFINLNTRSGFVKISYDSIPVDQHGYPLIPDSVSYSEAIYWYIVMKLTYSEWRSGKVRDAVYNDARSSWNFYCRQAYGESMMPTQGEMDGPIKNTWIRLIPEINAGDSFYDSLGTQEHIKNKNRRV